MMCSVKISATWRNTFNFWQASCRLNDGLNQLNIVIRKMYTFIPFGGGFTHMTPFNHNLSLMPFFDCWLKGHLSFQSQVLYSSSNKPTLTLWPVPHLTKTQISKLVILVFHPPLLPFPNYKPMGLFGAEYGNH